MFRLSVAEPALLAKSVREALGSDSNVLDGEVTNDPGAIPRQFRCSSLYWISGT